MELNLFGKPGYLNFMLDHFAIKLGLLKMFGNKMHISTNPYNSLTLFVKDSQKRTPCFEENPKTIVCSRVPGRLVYYYKENTEETRKLIFDDEKLTVEKDSFSFWVRIRYFFIIKKILKKENRRLRRDFIAVIKILSEDAVFPILFEELIVKKPVEKTIHGNEEYPIEIPAEKIFAHLSEKE